ncbi:MAG: phosphate ABC transporter permease PstA [Mobiluncus porci]|uniref:Phosphate transport system permease protein PstA n=1 Tax=Mobiluncus porci TaxID=2652278 RepID=A0A7K0K341_9ACTO|nr:phosphate ABC transporter permease PstA [Mobiluncus porci]MDD7542446.1 phosphate ABC transporter permease PstA [Mobiluncus porci]MDY5747754.1 phosphate ABC transporter permease PstA [Mobiluncus porci]MST49470.1 phosphate ABC transporter permease PstA [Mobiluncus porci]
MTTVAPEIHGKAGLSQSMEMRIKRAKQVNALMTGVFAGIGGFFLFLVIALAAYIVIRGAMSFDPNFLTFTSKGIMNQVFNTIYLVFLSLIVSVALGVPAGIYMAEYAPENRLTGFIRISIESLSSLPSIVVGLFGYLVFILMVGQQWNLLAGALAVSILNLPLVTTETEAAIRALPKDMTYGSAALGATHWTTITRVLLPAALPHLMTGVVLAAERGFGEAAALLYTAGMSTNINWASTDITSPTNPFNPMRPGETLSLHVWAMRTEAVEPNAVDIANFSAAVLVLIALAFSVLARYITKRVHASMAGLSHKTKRNKKGAVEEPAVSEETITASNFTDRFHDNKKEDQ